MANTTHMGYPKPVASNNISDDVVLLQQALDMVDGDVHALLTALSGKAASTHAHAISDVTGLVSALAGKAASNHNHTIANLEGVSGLAEAPPHYVLYKTPSAWVPGAPAAVLVSSMSLVAGDMLVVTGAGLVRLPKGTDGQVLKMVGGAPAWANP